MILSFDPTVPDADLDQFLQEMKDLMAESGLVQRVAAERHIRVAADDHAPLFVSSAIVRFDVADLAALNAAFTVPGIEELIGRWQARYPYRVVWANHAPL